MWLLQPVRARQRSSMATQTRDAAIVGIYEYPLRKAPGITPMQIKAESATPTEPTTTG